MDLSLSSDSSLGEGVQMNRSSTICPPGWNRTAEPCLMMTTTMAIDSGSTSAAAGRNSLGAEDTFLLYGLCTFGTLGLFSSTIVLYLTNTKELRVKNYIHFILNRAVVDFVICLHLITLQPLGILYWDATADGSMLCDIAGGVCSTLSSTMVFSEPLLAFNRYISICRNELYARIFKRSNICAMCVMAWILALTITTPHFILGNLGRIEGVMCQVQLLKKSSFLVYLLTDQISATVSYLVILYFHYKILAYIRRHQQQGMMSGQASRLQEDRELLKCITALAVFPLISSIPVGVCSIVFMQDQNAIPDFILCVANVLFAACPFMNSMATIFMVRPIRRQFLIVARRFVCRLVGGSSSSKNAIAPIPPGNVFRVSGSK